MVLDSKIRGGIFNAFYLTAGNIVSQFVALIGFFYIAKVLGPERYGMYSTVGAFVAIFQLLTLTGLSKVLVREICRNLDSFKEILDRNIGLRVYLALTSIIICIVSSNFTKYTDQIKFLITIFSFGLFEISINSYLSTIYQASEKMKYIACFGILSKVLFITLSVFFLYLGYGLLSIICINLLTRYLVLLINYSISRKIVRFRWNLKLNLDAHILKPTLVFSLVSFINTLAVQVDVLMVSLISTPYDVGIYSLADKLAKEGTILRNLIATAFFPIGVSFFSQNYFAERKIISYFLGILLLVLVAVASISFYIKDVVILLFGKDYSQSGEILKWLIFYLALNFSSVPLSIFLQATNNEIKLLWVTGIMALTNIPLNLLLFNTFGLIGIAYSTIVVYSLGTIILLGMVYAIIKEKRQANPAKPETNNL